MRTFTKVALAAFILSLTAATQAPAAQPSNKQWTFETEALFLHRNQTRGVPTSRLTTTDDRVVLGTNDLRFGFRPGARFTLGYHPDPNNTVELVYFGLHNFSDRAKVTSSSEDLQPVFEDGSFKDIDDFEDAFQHKIKYQSRLHNAEFNYKRHFSPWGMLHPSLLIGFRYLSVPEKFSLFTADSGPPPSDPGKYNIKTTNHLIGVQLGGVGTYRFNPSFDLGLRFNAGLFANIAKQRSHLVNDLDDIPDSDDIEKKSKSRTNAAGVAEAGLFATWNFNPNIALTAGYQILYLAGLALAPEQLASCNCQGAFSQLDTSGSAFYHGPSVGLKVSW